MSNKARKNLMLIAIISFCILVLGGTSYALLRSAKVSTNNYVINVGDVEVTFQGATNSLNVDKMYPMTDEEGASQEKELVFTVKNTGSVKAYFNVSMEETSTNPEFKSVIKYIVKKDPGEYNQPVILSDNKYIDYNASLDPDGEYTYHVKVYLKEETEDEIYMNQTFTAKIHIEASQETYIKTGIATEVIKAKIGKDGLVGVTNNNEPTTDKGASDIREYRYSGLGVNNYVYFNCKDNLEQNEDNCEIWRILGVFKDENGHDHLKLARNEELKREVFPATYTADGKTFNIQFTGIEDYAYYSYPTSGTSSNNWSEAGLMYWLNSKGIEDGYLKKLSSTAQNMIAESTYYLGNVYWEDTAVQSYEHERNNTKCSSSEEYSNNRNCYVWPNNEATWTGNIGLMYQSDYGFSIDSSYWSAKKLNPDSSIIKGSSWIYKEVNVLFVESFMLSSSWRTDFIAFLGNDGIVYGHGPSNSCYAVRPVLYLKAETSIIDGVGSPINPYKLELQ